jgi:hypothetical protein
MRSVSANLAGHERWKVILKSLGQRPDGCGGKCEALRRQMNRWGPDGCEQHLSEIVVHLRKAYDEQSLIDKLRVKAAAVASGVAFQIDDWNDPIPSLVRLAISRSRANA